jgi:hypothetical protein
MPYSDRALEAAWKRQKYEKVRAILRALREAPCHDCGQRFPWYVTEFDHTRGQKSFNVSKSMSKPMTKLNEEIEKCDLVCANCHKVRTHNRRQ